MSIQPMRSRNIPSTKLAELEGEIKNLKKAQDIIGSPVKASHQISYYMTQSVNGVWGRFINVIDGELTGGMISAVQSQAIVPVELKIIQGKVTRSLTISVTQSAEDIKLGGKIPVSSGDIFLIESVSESLSTISLTLTIEN